MKIKVQEVKKEFTPITVEITFESLEELYDFKQDLETVGKYTIYPFYYELDNLYEKLK